MKVGCTISHQWTNEAPWNGAIQSLWPRKVRVQSSTGKVMLTVFWDKKGVIVEHYLPKGQTVNSRSYCDLLQNHLRPAIRSKRRCLLSKGVCLQQDNARPHTANATMMTLRHMKSEVLPHPPYSPDLAPSDFHLFGPLKDANSTWMAMSSQQCMSGSGANHKSSFLLASKLWFPAGASALNCRGIMLNCKQILAALSQ